MKEKLTAKGTLTSWFDELLEDAENGCTDSMGILGYMYTRGFGVKKDVEKGKHYFQMEKDHLSGDIAKFKPATDV